MRYLFPAASVLWVLPVSMGAVHSYECDSHPLDDKWILLQNFCGTSEFVDRGRFVQNVAMCSDLVPISGQSATYRRYIGEFEGSGTFFVEWRVESTGNRSEIPFGGPCVVSIASYGPVTYWFGISRDQVEFFRDVHLPIPFFDIKPGVPHTYRLELYGDRRYALYIDDQMVDAGVPEAEYPSSTPRVNMHVRAVHGASTTTWDYLRWGDIPADGSADYDGNAVVDQFDYYFFHDCFVRRGPGHNDGPSCRFADMDGDEDVDLEDFAEFQVRATETRRPPWTNNGGAKRR